MAQSGRKHFPGDGFTYRNSLHMHISMRLNFDKTARVCNINDHGCDDSKSTAVRKICFKYAKQYKNVNVRSIISDKNLLFSPFGKN